VLILVVVGVFWVLVRGKCGAYLVGDSCMFGRSLVDDGWLYCGCVVVVSCLCGGF